MVMELQVFITWGEQRLWGFEKSMTFGDYKVGIRF
jgi:hypothetical protein